MSNNKKWEEKYKDLTPEGASDLYYKEGVMSAVLGAMQSGIDEAAVIYEKLKAESEDDLHVNIYINEDKNSMEFALASWDDDECGYESGEAFLVYDVGEAMEEALFVMEIMARRSTSVEQAINNWAEDLGWDSFGEFEEGYSYSDSWGAIEY